MASVHDALDPVIVEDASFEIGRFLRFPGEILVKVGDRVEPSTPIGSASASAGHTRTLHLARELGVSPDTIKRYLTKPIGSHFDAGEAVARARKGLRAVTADTPEAGRLSDINEIAGTATLAPDAGTQELESLVFGEVSQVVDGRGAVVRAGGARIRGVIALGVDSSGPIKTAVDRADRELTPDGVTADLRGALVLGGMTVSAAAIRKLAEVGARGVIVGSISEGDVRRVASNAATEPSARSFWQSLATNGPLAPELDQTGFTIFVTTKALVASRWRRRSSASSASATGRPRVCSFRVVSGPSPPTRRSASVRPALALANAAKPLVPADGLLAAS